MSLAKLIALVQVADIEHLVLIWGRKLLIPANYIRYMKLEDLNFAEDFFYKMKRHP